jgi:hypothetical protein
MTESTRETDRASGIDYAVAAGGRLPPRPDYRHDPTRSWNDHVDTLARCARHDRHVWQCSLCRDLADRAPLGYDDDQGRAWSEARRAARKWADEHAPDECKIGGSPSRNPRALNPSASNPRGQLTVREVRVSDRQRARWADQDRPVRQAVVEIDGEQVLDLSAPGVRGRVAWPIRS